MVGVTVDVTYPRGLDWCTPQSTLTKTRSRWFLTASQVPDGTDDDVPYGPPVRYGTTSGTRGNVGVSWRGVGTGESRDRILRSARVV